LKTPLLLRVKLSCTIWGRVRGSMPLLTIRAEFALGSKPVIQGMTVRLSALDVNLVSSPLNIFA
jgi:hypothetical protein